MLDSQSSFICREKRSGYDRDQVDSPAIEVTLNRSLAHTLWLFNRRSRSTWKRLVQLTF
jgi:hypothetical protein